MADGRPAGTLLGRGREIERLGRVIEATRQGQSGVLVVLGEAGVGKTALSFGSADDLAEAMRRASVAHGEHEACIGAADPDWPDWYAAYMVAEQHGAQLPQ